ncbi:MAG: PAS domain S-box protein, partial [Planctomycetaceae bacterium]|nr:PAS domain S-box protein [Planctomycetaceae bacterium]
PIEIGLSPIETGQGLFVLSAIIDITERLEMVGRLRQAAVYQRLATIVNSSEDAIIAVTLDGDVTDWNAGAERLYGYTAEEMIGRNVSCLRPPDRTQEEQEILDRLKHGVTFKHVETVRKRKDGTLVNVCLTVSPIRDADGRPIAAAAITQDISERKHLEAKLRRAHNELERRVAERTAELTARNQELEQFAYVASHDLQEPLRKVASCCQLLAEDYAERLDDNGREWIAFAVDGASRMRQLVTDLLEFSRVGTHGRTAEPTDSHHACEAALENLSNVINESGAEIICRPLPQVMADGLQLEQLFQNLIGNSIKYCSEERPIVEIGAEPEAGFWRFYVKDNGIGIDPEYHHRIFQIFQRLHRKEEYPGTGIGLAICKKVVERLGGRLWVESRSGQGSTFYFTLAAVSSTPNGGQDDDSFDNAALRPSLTDSPC